MSVSDNFPPLVLCAIGRLNAHPIAQNMAAHDVLTAASVIVVGTNRKKNTVWLNRQPYGMLFLERFIDRQ